jgi:hypothetical protein
MTDYFENYRLARKLRKEEGDKAALSFISSLNLSKEVKKKLINSAIGSPFEIKSEEVKENDVESIYSFYIKGLAQKIGNEPSNSIHININQTLERMEVNRPNIENSDRSGYGLVIGRIQSGKTSHLLGLSLQLLDKTHPNNCDIVIILSGLINDLKKQTYDRLEKSIEGFSHYSPLILPNRELDLANNNGTKIELDHYLKNLPKGGMIILIKKNHKVLGHLLDVLTHNKSNIKQRKIIIIDDESDHASLDTSDNNLNDYSGMDEDPSETNRLLRRTIGLISSNPLSWYIGYTATPFASLLIPDILIEGNDTHGKSLAPRDFVHSLPKPLGHLDNEKYFLSENINVEFINDFVEGSKEEYDIFRDLIIRHIISQVIKENRGIKGHHTSLIHASIETNIHQRISERVREIIDDLKSATECKEIIEEDLDRILKNYNISKDISKIKEILLPSSDKYYNNLINILSKIVVVEVNSRDRDDDEDSPQNLFYNDVTKSYIAVGGTRLSRGLTLEGLTNSLFTRYSQAPKYDTMMQMSRWCGYRKNYDDLVRIKTTEEIYEFFRDIAIAETDLRHKIESIPIEESPMDHDIWIIEHPGMSVTAPEKMRNVRRKSWGKIGTAPFFSYDHPLLTMKNPKKGSKDLYSSLKKLIENTNLINEFNHKPRNGASNFVLARDVPYDWIYDFLQDYHDLFTNDNPTKDKLRILLDPSNIETNNWTIALHMPKNNAREYGDKIGGNALPLRLINRSLNLKRDKIGRINNSSEDITLDLSPGEFRKNPLLILYLVDPNSTKDNRGIERVFDNNISLPIPLFGICMPQNNDAGIINYVARNG